MEFLTILLSGLLTVPSPLNFLLDHILESNIRQRLENADTLEVRLDNTPNYQLLQGKLDHLRVATRGLQLTDNLRLDTLELETDPIDINIKTLQNGNRSNLRQALLKPLQGGVRIVLDEEDCNQLLQSSEVKNRIEKAVNRNIQESMEDTSKHYELHNPNIDFLDNGRVKLSASIVIVDTANPNNNTESSTLNFVLETGITVENGYKIQLTDPVVFINDRQLSRRLVNGFAEGINEKLDLTRLENNGITARVLQWEVKDNQIHLASFIRIEGTSTP